MGGICSVWHPEMELQETDKLLDQGTFLKRQCQYSLGENSSNSLLCPSSNDAGMTYRELPLAESQIVAGVARQPLEGIKEERAYKVVV